MEIPSAAAECAAVMHYHSDRPLKMSEKGG
jgi:hypothetical protein